MASSLRVCKIQRKVRRAALTKTKNEIQAELEKESVNKKRVKDLWEQLEEKNKRLEEFNNIVENSYTHLLKWDPDNVGEDYLEDMKQVWEIRDSITKVRRQLRRQIFEIDTVTVNSEVTSKNEQNTKDNKTGSNQTAVNIRLVYKTPKKPIENAGNKKLGLNTSKKNTAETVDNKKLAISDQTRPTETSSDKPIEPANNKNVAEYGSNKKTPETGNNKTGSNQAEVNVKLVETPKKPIENAENKKLVLNTSKKKAAETVDNKKVADINNSKDSGDTDSNKKEAVTKSKKQTENNNDENENKTINKNSEEVTNIKKSAEIKITHKVTENANKEKLADKATIGNQGKTVTGQRSPEAVSSEKTMAVNGLKPTRTSEKPNEATNNKKLVNNAYNKNPTSKSSLKTCDGNKAKEGKKTKHSGNQTEKSVNIVEKIASKKETSSEKHGFGCERVTQKSDKNSLKMVSAERSTRSSEKSVENKLDVPVTRRKESGTWVSEENTGSDSHKGTQPTKAVLEKNVANERNQTNEGHIGRKPQSDWITHVVKSIKEYDTICTDVGDKAAHFEEKCVETDLKMRRSSGENDDIQKPDIKNISHGKKAANQDLLSERFWERWKTPTLSRTSKQKSKIRKEFFQMTRPPDDDDHDD